MRTKGGKGRDNGGGEGSEGGAGDGVVRAATAPAMGEGSRGEVRAKSRKARVTAASTRWQLNSNSGGRKWRRRGREQWRGNSIGNSSREGRG